MKKVDLLLIIVLIGVFLTVTTTGWLLIISGTVTFISVLLFGKEVHKVEDEETWKNNHNLVIVIGYINLFIHYLYESWGGMVNEKQKIWFFRFKY